MQIQTNERIRVVDVIPGIRLEDIAKFMANRGNKVIILEETNTALNGEGISLTETKENIYSARTVHGLKPNFDYEEARSLVDDLQTRIDQTDVVTNDPKKFKNIDEMAEHITKLKIDYELINRAKRETVFASFDDLDSFLKYVSLVKETKEALVELVKQHETRKAYLDYLETKAFHTYNRSLRLHRKSFNRLAGNDPENARKGGSVLLFDDMGTSLQLVYKFDMQSGLTYIHFFVADKYDKKIASFLDIMRFAVHKFQHYRVTHKANPKVMFPDPLGIGESILKGFNYKKVDGFDGHPAYKIIKSTL